MLPLPPRISGTVINTVLDCLIPIILPSAGGCRTTACDAALAMVADYRPETGEEFRLAGEIIGYSLQGLHALKTATLPTTPNGAMMQLLKISSSLRRDESAAQRKLDALQRARLTPEKKTERAPAAATTRPDAAASVEAPPHRSAAVHAEHSPAAFPGSQPQSAFQPAPDAVPAVAASAPDAAQAAIWSAAHIPAAPGQTGRRSMAQRSLVAGEDDALAEMLAAAAHGEYSSAFSAPTAPDVPRGA